MVYIPFLNIEVPEPRILEIIPDVVVTVLRVCARMVDTAVDAVYPLNPQQLQMVCEAQRRAIPREFDRVIQRQLEGKIKNEEQLSSELEDASYDYYRRMLRTSIVGRSDEGHEDFVARKLFGSSRSPTLQVFRDYAQEHPEALLDTEDALVASLDAPAPQNAAAELRGLRSLEGQAGTAWQESLQQQQQEVQRLRSQPRTGSAQARLAMANAGLGIGLGLLLFKAAGWGLQRALKALKKSKKKAAGGGGRPAGPIARQPRGSGSGAATAAAPAAPPGQARGAAATPGARGAPQPQAAQQQQQQQASEQAAAPARRARASTRTR